MSNSVNLSPRELQRIAEKLLVAADSAPDDAKMVADALLWADTRGRHPQGVFRIPVLAEMIEHGIVSSPALMTWDTVASSGVQLDANNGFGYVAGKRAVTGAIELARQHGIGIVTVKQSNHFGAAGYYCEIASDANCIGLVMTNATPKVAPHGGSRPVFGTNPIAFGCPTPNGWPILVDASTSAIAGSTIRSLAAQCENLPEGVALDRDGRPTVNPADCAAGSLRPAAGPKGSGLSLMVEVLCGILTGAGMSYEVGAIYSNWQRNANCGHVFIAIDINRFIPLSTFLERVAGLATTIKVSGANEAGCEVLLPGETRARSAEQAERDGITLPEESVQALNQLGSKLEIALPWSQHDGVNKHAKMAN